MKPATVATVFAAAAAAAAAPADAAPKDPGTINFGLECDVGLWNGQGDETDFFTSYFDDACAGKGHCKGHGEVGVTYGTKGNEVASTECLDCPGGFENPDKDHCLLTTA